MRLSGRRRRRPLVAAVARAATEAADAKVAAEKAAVEAATERASSAVAAAKAVAIEATIQIKSEYEAKLVSLQGQLQIAHQVAALCRRCTEFHKGLEARVPHAWVGHGDEVHLPNQRQSNPNTSPVKPQHSQETNTVKKQTQSNPNTEDALTRLQDDHCAHTS